MKKLLKFLAWTVGLLLLLVIALVLTIPLWIGPTVTGVSNAVVPEYTGTSFKLDGFALNPYSGRLSVSGLHLSNPEGYPVPEAVALESLKVEVATSTLFSDTIVIRDISIDGLYASYVSANGTNNFAWIAEYAKKKIGPKEEKEEEEEEKSKKKVVIERLSISGVRVKVSMLPEMPIPTIVLKDIGKESGGASWEEIGKTIADAAQSAFSSVGDGLGAALGVLGDGAGTLLGGATNVLGGATSVIGGTATNIIGGASEKVGAVTEKLGNATTNLLGGASKALDSVTGLLGGSSDDAAKKEAEEKKSDSAEKAADGAEKGKDAANDTKKSLGAGAVDAGKAIGEGAIDAGKNTGDGAKGALKKIGGLFGN